MFNKDASHMEGRPLHAVIAQRRNVVLVGDSLGDRTMADGLPAETVVAVGLCNANEGEVLPAYLAAFDAVLTGDAPLDWVVDVVRDVIAGGQAGP
jgi:cytosolic 5'-nucleotidase 3